MIRPLPFVRTLLLATAVIVTITQWAFTEQEIKQNRASENAAIQEQQSE